MEMMKLERGMGKLEEKKGREEVVVLMLVMVERFWGRRWWCLIWKMRGRKEMERGRGSGVRWRGLARVGGAATGLGVADEVGSAPVMISGSREERRRGGVREIRELIKIREEKERLRE